MAERIMPSLFRINIWSNSKFCFQKRYRSTEHSNGKPFDIIIAGGGMIGTTLACCLGKSKKLSNKRILLLEGSKEQNFTVGKYSNRVVALNNGTRDLLQSVGAWELISQKRFAPVTNLQVWDACSDSMITFNECDLDKSLAYIVENNVLLDAVTRVMRSIDNVTVQYGSKLKQCTLPSVNNSDARVHLEDGTTYSCQLLIGADGANSKVRQAMDVQYLTWNYKQMAIVATLKLSEPTRNVTAWQRFLPSGPVALLPLTDELSSLVWSMTTEEAKHLLKLSDESFVDAVNNALWKQFPQNDIVESALRTFDKFLESTFLVSNSVRQLPPSVSAVEEGSRAAFPLGFGHSTRYASEGVVLVGDAAHRVHPLAGQGVNLGFGDISCLVEVLGEAVYSGSKLGNKNYLLKYETLRQRHNLPTMTAIDGLQKLYGTTWAPVVLIRSLGLQFVHALSPLKRAIVNHAGV